MNLPNYRGLGLMLVLCAGNAQNSESAGRMQVHGKYTAAQAHAFYRSLNTIIVKQPKEDAQSWNLWKGRKRRRTAGSR